jgi:hypothetical protein
MEKGFKGVFKADSVIKTLVLCIVTIGSYLIYKLYRFSSQINQHTEFRIPIVFIYTSIFFFVISLCSLIYGLINLHDLSILKSSIEIHVVSSIFDVTWIIMVRNRINLIAGTYAGDKLWLNPFITSIFHVIYIQHKINLGLAKA